MFENAVELAALIEHTNLSPAASPADIERLCAEAVQYSFHAVCVNPCYVAQAAGLLKESGVKLCTVVGFPLGANTTAVKVMEGVDAARNGASELDVVMNVGLFKAHQYERAASDLKDFIVLTPHAVHKVIVEACYLSDPEKAGAARLAAEVGADFVKTSTGFGPSGATAADVAILKLGAGGACGVKAAGGIRDLDTLTLMVKAGASRIGTSSGAVIMEEYLKRFEARSGTA